MSDKYNQYKENLEDDLNIQHKNTPTTEKTIFHLHKHLEIVYTLSDNIVLYTENQAQHLPSHTLVILNTMRLHYFDYLDNHENCNRYVLYFNPEIINGLYAPDINLLDCFLRQHEGSVILTLSEEQRQPLLSNLENMAQFAISHKGESETSALLGRMNQLYLQYDLAKILILVNQIFYQNHGIPLSQSYQAHSQQVLKVCQYIDANYQETITIDSIAKKFAYSKTRLYTIFKEVLLMSVSDYIVQVRTTQAKSLLINTDYSVEIISQMVGYQTTSSFSRSFKESIGISPLQFRKKFCSTDS